MKANSEEKAFGKLWTSIKDFFYDLSCEFHELKKSIFPHKKKYYTNNKRRANIKKLTFIWVGLSIPLLNFLIFWVYGNFSSLTLAFRFETPTGWQYGFENFRFIFSELRNPYSTIVLSLVNTLKFFAWNFFCGMPLCYIISYFFYKKIAGYKFFRYVFFMPSIISAVIMTSFLKFMIMADGPIYHILTTLGAKNTLLLSNSDTAFGVLVFYNLWSGFGVNLIYFTANLNRIPKDVLEYAQIDGVNTWQEIIYILFPLTWPFFSTMLFLNLTGIFSSSGPVLLLTGGAYKTSDFAFWQYIKVTDGVEGSALQCAALGWVTTLIAIPFSFIFKNAADKVEPIEY